MPAKPYRPMPMAALRSPPAFARWRRKQPARTPLRSTSSPATLSAWKSQTTGAAWMKASKRGSSIPFSPPSLRVAALAWPPFRASCAVAGVSSRSTVGAEPGRRSAYVSPLPVGNLSPGFRQAHGQALRDGRVALEVLAGASCLPSLILLDLTMPAMGAEELVPILNRDYPDLRIIVTSGYPEEAARREFPPRAVAGFLQKPYTVAALIEKVEETLKSGGPNEEAPTV